MRRLVPTLCLLLATREAAADSHATLGIGGLGTLPGPDFGLWAGLSLWPRGPVGGRLDVFAATDLEPTRVEASLSYQLAATRPHLVLAGHAGLGVSLADPSPVLALGLSGELGHALGPFRILPDAALHLDLTGEEPVALTFVLGVGAGF
jgi:hypothetical protein